MPTPQSLACAHLPYRYDIFCRSAYVKLRELAGPAMHLQALVHPSYPHLPTPVYLACAHLPYRYDIFCRSAYVKLRELAGSAAQPTPAHCALHSNAIHQSILQFIPLQLFSQFLLPSSPLCLSSPASLSSPGAAAFEAAVAAVSLYGGTQAGDRTMLDALLPRSCAASRHAGRSDTRLNFFSSLPSRTLSSFPPCFPNPLPTPTPVSTSTLSPGAAAFEAAVAAVSLYGGAQAGYRTMLDALLPAAASLSRSITAGESAAAALAAAAQAAAAGAESTKSMPALAGRSSYVPAEVLASVPDPGAMAVAAWLQGAATAMQPPPPPVVESVAEPAAAAAAAPSAPQEQL
ncbi:unnamed protein product [Closterium sp. NIES-65]|nr:unnamed protein product [Closterium sp. NIES-65]